MDSSFSFREIYIFLYENKTVMFYIKEVIIMLALIWKFIGFAIIAYILKTGFGEMEEA